jgi:hypothetical protein
MSEAAFRRHATSERCLCRDGASRRFPRPDSVPRERRRRSTENCRNSPRSILDTSGWRMPNRAASSTCFKHRSFLIASILNTNCALTRCSSGFGMPRFLNTVRLPISYPLLLIAPLPLLSVRHRVAVVRSVRCRGAASASGRRFLLEGVKDVHRPRVSHAGGRSGQLTTFWRKSHFCEKRAQSGLMALVRRTRKGPPA